MLGLKFPQLYRVFTDGDGQRYPHRLPVGGHRGGHDITRCIGGPHVEEVGLPCVQHQSGGAHVQGCPHAGSSLDVRSTGCGPDGVFVGSHSAGGVGEGAPVGRQSAEGAVVEVDVDPGAVQNQPAGGEGGVDPEVPGSNRSSVRVGAFSGQVVYGLDPSPVPSPIVRQGHARGPDAVGPARLAHRV